jgi:hypothetical protein
MPVTNVKSKWVTGKLVFEQVRDSNGAVHIGNWPTCGTAPTLNGFELGTRVTLAGVSTRRTRAFVVGANDGGHDPTDRIESSCHTFTQSVDWSTGWSATALEGVFYGGYDLIATEDNMNISGAGGWIYLNDEMGGAAAPVVGASSGKYTYVCGLESWVALPADVSILATGVVCGIKLSNNFASGMTAGSGKTAAICIETVDTSGYSYMISTNSAANGFVANTHTLTLTPTAYHMLIDIGGTDYYIPVFDDHEWD